MTLPVVWIPEAEADLKEALAWTKAFTLTLARGLVWAWMPL